MGDATCNTCPWCDEDRCRKNPPTLIPTRNTRGAYTADPVTIHTAGSFWPKVVPSLDWCGKHPDRRPRVTS